MGLVLDWKASLGYRFDPFVDDDKQRFPLVGLEDLKETFNLWLIKGGQFGTLSGEKGSGKTVFLRWVETELAPKRSHQQHYVDARISPSAESVRTTLSARSGILGRLFHAKPKDDADLLKDLAKQQTVVLIDNASALHKDALHLIGAILDKTPTHVVFADTHEKITKMELPTKDGLSLRIARSTHDDLRAILTSRINAAGIADTHPFTDQDLQKLVKEADGNPARLLADARERAIELSLKAGKGQSVATSTVAVSSSEPSQKKGFISISIAKSQPEEAPATPKPASPTVALDAEQLSDIIAQTSESMKEDKKPAKKLHLNDDEVKIFHELAAKHEKPAAKKKAVKKPKKK